MPNNEQSIKNLEFDKVKSRIASFAATPKAKDAILALFPSNNLSKIQDELSLLSEAYAHIAAYGPLGICEYEEIEPFVLRAEKRGVLAGGEFLAVLRHLRVVRDVKRSLTQAAKPSVLQPYAEGLDSLPSLALQIQKTFMDENELFDDASPVLFDIRRKKRDMSARIKEKLQTYCTSSYKKMLADSFITTRMGRYVLPVKSEYQNVFPGVVHDVSASGLTVYMEPNAVAKLGNALKELEAQEKKEIAHIYLTLSAEVAQQASTLLDNEELLVFLDVLFAKAQYAFVSEHTCPVVQSGSTIQLYQAFHPLIGKEKCVRSTIVYPQGVHALIITGPNTGGKTVTLKTIGLCALMAQSSLFIPAGQGSVLGVFDQIFADIGDEQSIAQSLSTFSSHMKTIVQITQQATASSLVLLDELGSGTDPQEGAALAQAILTFLIEKEMMVGATTHYSEIKQFALMHPGAVNASMEFDVATLRPTYRLHIGVAGRSNAFEISSRLGLEQSILQKAKEIRSTKDDTLDALLSSLDEKLALAKRNYEQSEALLQKQTEMQQALQRERASLHKREAEILDKAKQQAALLVDQTREQAHALFAKLKEENKPVSSSSLDKKLSKLASDLQLDKAEEAVPLADHAPMPGRISVGDQVYCTTLGMQGEVIEIDVKGERAVVAAGALQTKLALKTLKKVGATAKKRNVSHTFINTKPMTISPRLDLRGKNTMDVENELEKYLDDAFLANLKVFTIVHGKGEGVLQNAVRRILKASPQVKHFRAGQPSEGGAGVTIVELK